MLKRSLAVFGIILFGLVGWLSFQRTEDENNAQFLTLTNGNYDSYYPEKSSSQIILVNPDSFEHHVLHDNLPIFLGEVQWSGNGKWLYYYGTAYASRDNAKSLIQRVRAGSHIQQTVAEGYSLKFAPHNDRLAYLNDDSQIVIRVDDNPILLHDYVRVSGFSWTADGEWLVFTAQLPEANIPLHETHDQVYRAHYTGSPIEALTDMPTWKSATITSPNGEWFAFYDGFGTSAEKTIWQISATNQIAFTVTEPKQISTMAWSPDSNYLAYIVHVNPTLSELVLIRQDTFETEIFMLNHGSIYEILWSPDSTSIYFGTFLQTSSEVYHFDLTTQKESFIFASQVNGYGFIELAWSPPLSQSWHPRRLGLGSIGLLGLSLLVWFFRHISRTSTV